MRVITVREGAPNANRLPYIAAPGSARGIVVSSSTSGLQQMMIDPSTGAITLKPKHLPTLRLLNFSAFLSLMFRSIDMLRRENTTASLAAAEAIQVLVRELTRQYESLQWSQEDLAVWNHTAYLRYTHMVQTRILLTGYNAEAAFLTEAKKRSQNSPPVTPASNSNIIHGASRRQNKHNNKENISPTPAIQTKSQSSSHWFICPCCSKINDHFAPLCPTQINGPKPVPEAIKASTFAAINAAPIPQSAKANLTRMATSVYTKYDNKQ